MRRHPTMLIAGVAAVVIAVSVGASSPRLTPAPNGNEGQRVRLLVADPHALPEAPLLAPTEPIAAIDDRAVQAATEAAQAGADISFTLLDRRTGEEVSEGDGAAFPIASVVKLFIADDLLMHVAQGKTELQPEDRQALDAMLRSSDDSAAQIFWDRGGGSAIISRVIARYGLTATSPPYDGNWWTVMSTTVDLVRYYAKLLDGAGGLPAEQANLMLTDLEQSTPVGIDGYPQRFGIPDGLFGEPVAVKQGWMCCWNGPNWLHMSTGVIGADRRYVMAIVSLQPVDDTTARDTLTHAVAAMFPSGHV